MNSLISLEKVNYQIADQHILHDVDWQIPSWGSYYIDGTIRWWEKYVITDHCGHDF
ncbi:hypothetical protein AWA2013_26410 [Lactiplantibacillus plantarum]|nr:hypothetical protein AWA2013_26410 [Lactiplantibacillus plantarum]